MMGPPQFKPPQMGERERIEAQVKRKMEKRRKQKDNIRRGETKISLYKNPTSLRSFRVNMNMNNHNREEIFQKHRQFVDRLKMRRSYLNMGTSKEPVPWDHYYRMFDDDFIVQHHTTWSSPTKSRPNREGIKPNRYEETEYSASLERGHVKQQYVPNKSIQTFVDQTHVIEEKPIQENPEKSLVEMDKEQIMNQYYNIDVNKKWGHKINQELKSQKAEHSIVENQQRLKTNTNTQWKKTTNNSRANQDRLEINKKLKSAVETMQQNRQKKKKKVKVSIPKARGKKCTETVQYKENRPSSAPKKKQKNQNVEKPNRKRSSFISTKSKKKRVPRNVDIDAIVQRAVQAVQETTEARTKTKKRATHKKTRPNSSKKTRSTSTIKSRPTSAIKTRPTSSKLLKKSSTQKIRSTSNRRTSHANTKSTLRSNDKTIGENMTTRRRKSLKKQSTKKKSKKIEKKATLPRVQKEILDEPLYEGVDESIITSVEGDEAPMELNDSIMQKSPLDDRKKSNKGVETDNIEPNGESSNEKTIEKTTTQTIEIIETRETTTHTSSDDADSESSSDPGNLDFHRTLAAADAILERSAKQRRENKLLTSTATDELKYFLKKHEAQTVARKKVEQLLKAREAIKENPLVDLSDTLSDIQVPNILDSSYELKRTSELVSDSDHAFQNESTDDDDSIDLPVHVKKLMNSPPPRDDTGLEESLSDLPTTEASESAMAIEKTITLDDDILEKLSDNIPSSPLGSQSVSSESSSQLVALEQLLKEQHEQLVASGILTDDEDEENLLQDFLDISSGDETTLPSGPRLDDQLEEDIEDWDDGSSITSED